MAETLLKSVSAPSGPRPVAAAGDSLLFRMRDQLLFASACAIAVMLMGVNCLRVSGWGVIPIELERQAQQPVEFKIDLNTATWVEWSQLPELGPVLAKRIVAERERGGPFRDVTDLDRVKGIGPKRIEKLRPFIHSEPPVMTSAHGSDRAVTGR